MRPLPTSFFRRPAEVVARDLLGATIVSTIGGRSCAGLIVETEAYLGHDDPASHAYLGRRHQGNESIYGPPGIWYVYRSYGVHWCANLVVRGPAGGAAVLLRAVLPVEGEDLMRARRGGVAPSGLANGPGKLTQALGITRALDGMPMGDSPVQVGRTTKRPAPEILVTPRIGITKARDWPLRFLLRKPPAR
ncbi:MAG TPA: DNA-3-methyladenine glycosylase [Gemmatimonadales bacterium]|nr:DNA-3-methyladenine glycosylase [Gemmatimonadales bacterium]